MMTPSLHRCAVAREKATAFDNELGIPFPR